MQLGWIFIIVGVIIAFFSPIIGLILVLIGLALLAAPYANIGRR